VGNCPDLLEEKEMTDGEFQKSLERSIKISHHVLAVKEIEYSDGKDRLVQFKTAIDEGINPMEALVGFARKHWTSIVNMAKAPLDYTNEMWTEKLVDLRNYTLLADALLQDMRREHGKYGAYNKAPEGKE
jgi:hypothetical protein